MTSRDEPVVCGVVEVSVSASASPSTSLGADAHAPICRFGVGHRRFAKKRNDKDEADPRRTQAANADGFPPPAPSPRRERTRVEATRVTFHTTARRRVSRAVMYYSVQLEYALSVTKRNPILWIFTLILCFFRTGI